MTRALEPILAWVNIAMLCIGGGLACLLGAGAHHPVSKAVVLGVSAGMVIGGLCKFYLGRTHWGGQQ